MRKILLTIALAAAAAAPTFAQSPGETEGDSSEIVVEGHRVNDRQIGQFIEALTDVPPGGQIGQFELGVCPASVGLTAVQNEAVGQRMRRVAAAAGVPVAGEGCRPNVLVIVARDKEATIEALHKKYPAYFWGMSDRQARTLAKSPGSAAAWHVVGLLDADGTPLTRDIQTGILSLEATNSPSRVTAASRPHFLGAVVVVELQALAGISTTQLADYAALRTFAETDPMRAAKLGTPTILTLIKDHAAGRATRLSLTQWDLSFLKSLYGTSNLHYAHFHRGSMKQAFKKDLENVAKQRE